MKKILFSLLLGFFLLSTSCTQSGPRETLDLMARAMEENNSQTFLAQINMPLFTENYIKNFTNNDSTLNSLNSIGDLLGLGSLDNLLGSIVDFRAQIDRNFNRGITTGELMAQCKVATTPDCPWYPSALRDARIVELGPNAAIACVTTPARLTSWIALARGEKGWQVVGTAVMEADARTIAAEALNKKPEQGRPTQNPDKPVNI